MATRNPRGEKRRQDGSQRGRNSGGRGINQNTKPCPTGGPGNGNGGGRGGGRNR